MAARPWRTGRPRVAHVLSHRCAGGRGLAHGRGRLAYSSSAVEPLGTQMAYPTSCPTPEARWVAHITPRSAPPSTMMCALSLSPYANWQSTCASTGLACANAVLTYASTDDSTATSD